MVRFSRIGRHRLLASPPQHFAAVKFAEIDRLGRVAIGLGPGFCHFEDHPSRKLMLSPLMTIRYSRPSSSLTFSIAERIASAFSGFEKSVKGSFLNSSSVRCVCIRPK